MKTLLGPILGFRSATTTLWKCCVLYVFEGSAGTAPGLVWNQGADKNAAGRLLFTHGTAEVWVYEMEASLKAAESTVSYHLANDTNVTSFQIPAKGAVPRMAYCSCNGFSDPKLARDTADPLHSWKNLAESHKKQPFHLLLMGGDQVYADQMWAKVPELEEWSNKMRFNQVKSGFTQVMKTKVRQHYFDLYTVNWARTPCNDVFASVPSIMMWDDHDITDGYGSHPDNLQKANPALAEGGVLPGIFKQAKEFFEVFQLRTKPGEPRPESIFSDPKNLSSLHKIGPVALFVADLRSERTRDEIISEESWHAIEAALLALPAGGAIKHLLVMSSIPVVFPNAGMLGGLAGLIPWDPVTDPQDDLIDQWADRRHQSERECFVRILFKLAEQKGIRVTLLTGDVHLAALGLIENERKDNSPLNSNIITQLVASGIVHPSASSTAVSVVNRLASLEQEVYRGVKGRLVEFWSGGPRVLAGRNWLSLTPIEDGALRAQWQVEGMNARLTKDIGPCGPV